MTKKKPSGDPALILPPRAEQLRRAMKPGRRHHPLAKPTPSRELLRLLYEDHGWTIDRIARALEVGSSTVSKWFLRLDIDTQTSKDALDPGHVTLRSLYHDEGLSLAQIGRRYDVSHTTVARWFRRHRIDTRPSPFASADCDPGADELRRLYHDEGMTLRDIGAHFGVSATTIRRWMADYEIGRRDSAKLQRKRSRDPGAKALRKLYHDKQLSLAQVGDKLGVSRSTVLKWMRRHGIERR